MWDFSGYPLKMLLHFTKEEKIRWPKFLESVNHIAKVRIQHTNSQSCNINISFALTLLSAFFFLLEAAWLVIPMFLLQAATNEAHLLSRENKAKQHSQSSICCYIGGLWIGVWAMPDDWGGLDGGNWAWEKTLNCEIDVFLIHFGSKWTLEKGRIVDVGRKKIYYKL